MASQQDIALQMVAQLRLLDPSASAEVGTPERKILDTVAQTVFDSQVDLDALSAQLDVDSKYGAGLDRFLNLFSFNRQKGTYATGFVTFARVTPSNYDIRIPANTTVAAPAIVSQYGDVSDVLFQTVYEGILPAGSTYVVVPIRASISGESGNVATNRISIVTGSSIGGITSVYNEFPTANGKNVETDEEFKVRFKNTVFRNLAGTEDQYLALAISTAYSTKANVIGPQSRFREYIQVPSSDDTVGLTGGTAGQYSSAMSTIPFAKYLYKAEQPVFVSSRDLGPSSVFYRQDIDFRLNTLNSERNRGDAKRLFALGNGPDPSDSTIINPSVTFYNVYTGINGSVQAIRPGDLVLLEYAYMSEASRNDLSLRITNAVDVYIDGGNEVSASTITTRPTTATAFVDDANSRFNYENYRRLGEPEKRPVIGNVFMPLFWQPVTDLPDQIVVGDDTYFRDIHYWVIQDVSTIGGTVRARSGIEWSTKIGAQGPGEGLNDPTTWTGRIVTVNTGDPIGGQPIEVENYYYDKNIVDLQAALEGAKQVTTDVLAHKAKKRYFKVDVTAMYTDSASLSEVNQQVSAALASFYSSQYFGSVIQLSDILQVIHDVPGIDNVRWTSDTPGSADLARVYETDIDGKPLTNVSVDTVQPGNAGQKSIQGLYLTGAPTSGTFVLRYGSNSATLNWNATAAQIDTAVTTIAGTAVTVTEDTRSTVASPRVRSFRISFDANGARQQIGAFGDNLGGGDYIMKNDFFLRDDELAAIPTSVFANDSGLTDTVEGAIIRPRAQNTWVRT